MRLRILLGLFAAATLSIVVGSTGYGQGKGFKFNIGDKGNGGQPGGFKFDPAQFFDMIAKGQPAIVIADANVGIRGRLEEYAQAKGITNGQITREQWTDYTEWSRARRANNGNAPQATTLPTSPSAAPGAPPPGATEDMLKLWADADFARFDENGDGKLNADEMPAALRKEVLVWDKDNDGMIDREEYRKYFITRVQDRLSGSASKPGANVPAPEDDLDTRPVVYRAGKLPAKGLPTWFKQLDADADGQIALYEWRHAGKNLEEFKFWDRDDDGFITPEEALHVNAALLKTADPLVASADATPDGNGQFGMMRGPGAPGGGMFRGGQGGGAPFGGQFGGGQFGGGGMFRGGQGGGAPFGGGGGNRGLGAPGGQFGGGAPFGGGGGGQWRGGGGAGGQFGGANPGGGQFPGFGGPPNQGGGGQYGNKKNKRMGNPGDGN